MNKNYISFSPYNAGLCNVIMSYQLAFALAHISNRTLILPKKTFIQHIDIKNQWYNIWEIFDKDILRQEFDIIEAEQNGDTYEYKFEKNNIVYTDCCFVNDISKFQNDNDFLTFSEKRELLETDRPEKIIHFERNLFGNYCYYIYAGDSKQRNILKDKINKVFTYNSKYYELVENLNMGSYNAVHVRRNDFTSFYKEGIKNISNKNSLLEAIKKIFPKNLPLYICTDEKDLEFFKEIEKEYIVYYYNDYNLDLTTLEKAVVEQIICSKAVFFIGTNLSTYTKRINIMRGIDGLQADDYMGINKIIDKPIEILNSPMPWIYKENRKWEWNDSSHINWIKE
jgi:hypothetical protein